MLKENSQKGLQYRQCIENIGIGYRKYIYTQCIENTNIGCVWDMQEWD